jgi:phosphatidylserine decarboxylase
LEAEAFAARAARAGLEGMDLATLSGCRVTRISTYLSLFDVHVNRAPISCRARFLGYFPGKHFFTIQEKSSDHNQHNAILMRNEQTTCLVNQIVGPICRRVVYWPDHNAEVDLQMGERIGMMKFGSRLDLYFPSDDITVLCAVADRVRAGETVIARLGRVERE